MALDLLNFEFGVCFCGLKPKKQQNLLHFEFQSSRKVLVAKICFNIPKNRIPRWFWCCKVYDTLDCLIQDSSRVHHKFGNMSQKCHTIYHNLHPNFGQRIDNKAYVAEQNEVDHKIEHKKLRLFVLGRFGFRASYASLFKLWNSNFRFFVTFLWHVCTNSWKEPKKVIPGRKKHYHQSQHGQISQAHRIFFTFVTELIVLQKGVRSEVGRDFLTNWRILKTHGIHISNRNPFIQTESIQTESIHPQHRLLCPTV